MLGWFSGCWLVVGPGVPCGCLSLGPLSPVQVLGHVRLLRLLRLLRHFHLV